MKIMDLNSALKIVLVLLASAAVVDSIQSTLDSAAGNLMKADVTNRCSFNGGICIMNSFCHCKKNFYGRYCEHRVRHQSCGTIRHGTWMAAGCHLCHCFDGMMTCKLTSTKGCDTLSYVEGYENDHDYMVGMDKKVEDYNIFYDDDSSVSDTPVSGTDRDIPLTSLVLAAMLCALSLRWLAS